jgi:ABC-type multidrug transport system fused ATPase/permease subunit
LKDVSFTVQPGEWTGAVKTTIVSLITRFYDVQRGISEMMTERSSIVIFPLL